jgi:hypothetical protein
MYIKLTLGEILLSIEKLFVQHTCIHRHDKFCVCAAFKVKRDIVAFI